MARTALIVVLIGTLARLVIAATIGLGVDESYAVAVAQPASLSYYDHPPLVFWITALVERLGGARHDVLLRLPFIALFAATTWLVFRLTQRLFDERAALYAAALLQLIPVLSVADGGWILPDGPLLFGFAATALCLSHLWVPGEPRAWRWWLAAGASAGIALLSKYHAIFLIAGTLVYLLTTPVARRWLARPEPYLAGLLALLMATPVLVWNARHDWASLRYQGARADVNRGLHVVSLLQNLAGQAGYILPWIWIPLVWQFALAVRRGPRDPPRWMLACLAAGPLLVFTALSLGGRPGLPHWPAPGFLFLVPLLADALARADQRGRARAVRAYLAGTAIVIGALLTFAVSQIRTGWFSRAFPALFVRGDPSLDALDWRELRAAVSAVSRVREPIVVATNWIDGAKIGAALSPDGRVLCLNADSRQFHFVADRRSLAGRNALIVLRAGADTDPTATLANIRSNFHTVDSAPSALVTIWRGGRDAVQLRVYRGIDLSSAGATPGRR